MKDKAYYAQFLTNSNVVAYLNAISRIEGPTYYTANGGGVYPPTSTAHPDRIFPGGTSGAYGRYQFMPDTWNGNILPALGPLDIRQPRDQDIAAIYLLDFRGTLDKIVAGDCKGSLNANASEWAAIPRADGSFAYNGQRGPFDANGFCNLVNSLKGTTLPEGPLVNNNAPNLLANTSAANGATGSPFAEGGANFSDINCPPIKEDDLYRANFQITNPGCKISGPVQPITGSSTNGGTVNNSSITNNSVGFSINSQGFGQCSALRNPTNGVPVNSPFGWRNGKQHKGVDMAAPTGTPIYAASNGIVDYAQWNTGGYGNRIEIVSPEDIRTTYSHLEVIKCKVQQEVKVGQQIGDMGSTGFSTGPHLHFEVQVGAKPFGALGTFIDPQTCIKL